MERSLEPEWLDSLGPEHPLARSSRNDLQRLNFWMGNAKIVGRALRNAVNGPGPRRLVEVGAGDGRFMWRVANSLRGDWKGTEILLLDRQAIVLPTVHEAFLRLGWKLRAMQADVIDCLNAATLEARDAIIANLFLHHFSDSRLKELLHKMAARTRTFIAVEPRRSPFALF